MAEKLLLINPKKPPSKRRKSRKVTPKASKRKTTMAKSRRRRTAAQKRATARLVAMNRARGRRKPNPARPRRAKARRRPATGYTVGRAPVRRRKMNPIRRRRRRAVATMRRRRNPIRRGFFQTTMNNLVIPAAMATGGALALDVLWAYLPIPVTIKAGPFRHVAKGAGAVGMAMLAGMLVSKRTADAMGMGALTVVMHTASKEFLARSVPTLRMDGMGYMSPALPVGHNNLGYYAGAGALPHTAGNNMGYYPPPARMAAPAESEANFNFNS